MYSDLDTEAFLAYAKAQHQERIQWAQLDALQLSGVLRQQSRAHRSRHDSALRHMCRSCRRAVRVRCQALWQRLGRRLKGKSEWAALASAQNKQRFRACRAVE